MGRFEILLRFASLSSICDHIREPYASVGGEPPIFWIFAATALPPGYRLERKDSQTGDRCHHNLLGLTDRQLRNLIINVPLSAMSICRNGFHAQLQLANIPD